MWCAVKPLCPPSPPTPTVAAGEPVIVAGLSPSTAPWDALAVFEWDKGGTTEAQTNAFTVLSAHILADIDLDGDCFTSNDVRRSLFPLPGDWAFPLSGTQRHAYLYFNFALPGHTTLSLEGPDNAFRAWTLYEGDPILPGNVRTNPYPYYADIEALAPGTGALTFSFHGTGVASNFNCSHTLNITAWDIVKPSGNTIGFDNSTVWLGGQLGVTFDCQITPALPDTEIYWTLDSADFPIGNDTKITWEPWDVANNRPHVGVGTNPKLKVTYENPLSKYTDFMPPDNRWFGKKKITVQVGDTTVTRPVWFFFNPHADRILRQGGKKERAWFHYYKVDRVVSALADMDFEFDMSLPIGTPALHSWNAISNDRYYVGPGTYDMPAMKPLYNLSVFGDSYGEEHYPLEEKKAIHHLAKYCEHEFWHDVLTGETRWPFGLGHADADGDGMSDAREAEFGTSFILKDTCGLSRYSPEYSSYASYADQELFCRVKQGLAPLGDESKDWAYLGAQHPGYNEDDE